MSFFSRGFSLAQESARRSGSGLCLCLGPSEERELSPDSLYEFYGMTGRPIVDAMVTGVIAYADPASCFSTIADLVKREPDLNKSLDWCGVMSERGELSYWGILFDKYLLNIGKRNAEYLLMYIRDIIGDGMLTLDPEDLEDEVPKLYSQLVDKFKSEKVIVFRGNLFHVITFAEYLLTIVGEPFFHSGHRRTFEAATGIDCSSWHQDGRLRPLSATATLEGFLESPQADQYEKGVRYFWGGRFRTECLTTLLGRGD